MRQQIESLLDLDQFSLFFPSSSFYFLSNSKFSYMYYVVAQKWKASYRKKVCLYISLELEKSATSCQHQKNETPASTYLTYTSTYFYKKLFLD